jgi:hypothetical protein
MGSIPRRGLVTARLNSMLTAAFRIVGECRITVVDGQIHDNRPMTSALHLWNEPTPAPSAMPGPVHKDERAHDGVPGSMPEQ